MFSRFGSPVDSEAAFGSILEATSTQDKDTKPNMSSGEILKHFALILVSLSVDFGSILGTVRNIFKQKHRISVLFSVSSPLRRNLVEAGPQARSETTALAGQTAKPMAVSRKSSAMLSRSLACVALPVPC